MAVGSSAHAERSSSWQSARSLRAIREACGVRLGIVSKLPFRQPACVTIPRSMIYVEACS